MRDRTRYMRLIRLAQLCLDRATRHKADDAAFAHWIMRARRFADRADECGLK